MMRCAPTPKVALLLALVFLVCFTAYIHFRGHTFEPHLSSRQHFSIRYFCVLGQGLDHRLFGYWEVSVVFQVLATWTERTGFEDTLYRFFSTLLCMGRLISNCMGYYHWNWDEGLAFFSIVLHVVVYLRFFEPSKSTLPGTMPTEGKQYA